MKGTSPSRTSRIAANGNECHDGVADLINSSGRGSPWPLSSSASISPRSVFAVHCVDEHGKPVLVRASVPRATLHALIASLPPCTIGMEACSGAHHWARLFVALGHTVRLIAPKFVAPYRLSGKRGK